MLIRFEWDATNAISHLKKHGISFETASRVFADPDMLIVMDRIENGEQRWQRIGRVADYILILVAHTVWHGDDGVEIIRIISARKADKSERARYENAIH